MSYCSICGKFDPSISFGKKCKICRQVGTGSRVISDIIKRTKKGESVLFMIVGMPRKGKTTASLWIAENLAECFGETFDPKRDLFYDLYGFMKGVNQAGTVVIFDEAGKDANYLNWYSTFNKVFFVFNQTQAYKNHIYIIIIPFSFHIAKAHRHFLQYMGFVTERGHLRIYEISSNPANISGSKIYRTLREIWQTGTPEKIDWDIAKKKEIEQKERIENEILREGKEVAIENIETTNFFEKVIEALDKLCKRDEFISAQRVTEKLKSIMFRKYNKSVPRWLTSRLVASTIKQMGFTQKKLAIDKKLGKNCTHYFVSRKDLDKILMK